MYGWSNRRFMAGAEYVASYNWGNTVPYTTYNWGTGQNCAPMSQTVISSSGRGNNRPVWEMVYNHYANRLGVAVPNIAGYAATLRPEGGGGNYGTTSGGYDQLGFGTLTFTRDPLPSSGPANGTYKIFARHSGKALDVANNGTANGANVQQWPSNDCTCQQWNITHTGNGQYTIVGVSSGKNLDVSAGSTTDGANIHIWQATGANNQKFTFTPTSGGYYRITPVHSGKAIDVSGNSTADGANVQQWTYNGGNNQQWQLASVTALSSARTGTATTTIETANTDKAAQAIIIYPNPVVGELVVKLSNGFEKGSVITFTDAAGRLLRNVPVKGTEYILPLGTLSSGVYFIKVSSGEKSITKKIIKQ
jgi:hypothetical protein